MPLSNRASFGPHRLPRGELPLAAVIAALDAILLEAVRESFDFRNVRPADV